MVSQCPPSTIQKSKEDVYIVAAFFTTISVVGLPVGAFLVYRSFQIHRSLPNDDDDSQ